MRLTAVLLDHLVLIYSRTFFIIRRILNAIRYIANGPIDTSTKNLVMDLSGGDEKRVALLPPSRITATSKGIGGTSSKYSSTLTFRLDLTRLR